MEKEESVGRYGGNQLIRKQGFQQQVYERHGGPDSRKHKMTGRNLLDVLEYRQEVEAWNGRNV